MPKFTGPLAKLVQTPREEDAPDLHPAHQALTRLTGPTASVICLFEAADGTLTLPHSGERVASLRVRPMNAGGIADVARLLFGEVSLAHRGVVAVLWKAPTTPKEWGDVGLLERHHLICFRDGRARVGEYELRLSNDCGLDVSKADGDAEAEG